MTDSDSLRAVQAAVDYIEEHLDERVTAFAVAARVGFSEFHFHRIFVSVLGESVSAYQRRRRLSRAARSLKKTKRPLMQISLDAGFESQETFSRAFKALFGSTPGQYRKQGGMFAMEKPKLTTAVINHLHGGLTMEPKFVEFPGQTVVGLGAGFNPDTTVEIPKLWQKFVGNCHELGMVTRPSFGVCMGEHPQIQKKDGESFVYMAAVPSKGAAPANMVAFDIPPGKYAVFTHRGSIKDFPHTVKYIWSTWIPEHRQLYRESADFELYDERFDPESGSGEVDVYIPVN